MDPYQLAVYQRVHRRLDDRDHESAERITHRHEAAHVAAVGERLYTTSPDRATQHTIHLLERALARAFTLIRAPALSERPERCSHARSFNQRSRRARGLLQRASSQRRRTFGVHNLSRGEPRHEAIEGCDRVHAYAKPRVVGVHEVEPEAPADKDERWGVGAVSGASHAAKIARRA